MLQFTRPSVNNTDFEAKAKTLRKAISQAVKKKKPLSWENELWSDYKSPFSLAQYGKCGYCELKIAAGQPAAVDHIAPKSEVLAVSADETTWGIDAEPGLTRLVRGSRPKEVISTRGYWYLAYQWTNYVYACFVCNSSYKGARFPLSPRPPKGWSPSPRSKKHRPQLLSCYDHPFPWRHFIYDVASGAILGNTDEGRMTIATCGLHRGTLQTDRLEKVRDAERYCKKIKAAIRAGNHQSSYLVDLVRLGGDDRAFAGAVRGVAEKLLGISWDEITREAATVPE